MRRYLLTRSAYGPAWSPEANRRRLNMTRGITIPSVLGQLDGGFEWIVLLHRDDALLDERRAAFTGAGAHVIDFAEPGDPAHVAWAGYRAGWAEAIGPRDEVVAMTRLDDDDALAPWVMGRVHRAARAVRSRTALVCPLGVRVWQGRYTYVTHRSNAMQTLVTLPGDAMTVYDYGHRDVRRVAHVRMLDPRPAWVWSRHADTISGWRMSSRPLTDAVRAMFPIDWSLFGEPQPAPRTLSVAGRFFR